MRISIRSGISRCLRETSEAASGDSTRAAPDRWARPSAASLETFQEPLKTDDVDDRQALCDLDRAGRHSHDLRFDLSYGRRGGDLLILQCQRTRRGSPQSMVNFEKVQPEDITNL